VADGGVSGEPTAGEQAGVTGEVNLLLSEPGRRFERITDAAQGVGGRAGALWVSPVDDSVATRGLAGGPAASVSPLSAGKPAGANENPPEAGG